MANLTVTLTHGLKLGERTQLEAVLRPMTAGDVLDASGESEKLMPTPEGYQLVPSPTLAGMHTLRRQVVRIGEIEGPLTLGQLRLLTTQDLQLLQAAAETLNAASLNQASREVARRGRDDEPSPTR